MMTLRRNFLFFVVLGALAFPRVAPANQAEARELAGLWQAKLRFGPDIYGPLIIEKNGTGWRAEIRGRTAEAQQNGDTLTFNLPDGYGGFRGYFAARKQRISGHWTQNRGPWASPVTLTRMDKADRWRGEVTPLFDAMTMYLKVVPRDDGTMRAFVKNPEVNAGYFMDVASLERDGKTVRLLTAPSKGKPGEVVSEGVFIEGTLSLSLRGGTYDLERVADDAPSDFYPRSRPGTGAAFRYAEPPLLDDGWPVARPEDVGLSTPSLEKLVRAIIDAPIDSVSTLDVHGVLIARHGKLALEEYFHSENRDKPHDTRSAAKSVCSVLVGAAIQSGVPLTPQSRVYEVLNGGKMPGELDARKQKMTLENLLTMSSGLNADDSDDNSPGNEDKVQEGDNPNWWKLTRELEMVREAGEKAVYASMQPNLVGCVLRTASHRHLADLFHDLVAEPMQIQRYWLNLQPNGEPYWGGGTRFLPRDFMKFGQLLVNGGVWNGRRVVSKEWVERSTTPIAHMGVHWIQGYGYLWWVIDYPFQGKTVKAFYAGGNGGQVVMGIPELDLVIAFYGGNYADLVMFQIQRKLIPDYILPSIIGK